MQSKKMMTYFRALRNSFLMILTVVLSSCSTVKVVNLGKEFKPSDNKMIYALPRTNIIIDITLTEVRFFKGPYADYAEKYLGITNVNKADKTEYFITGAEISTHAEPDPDQYYCILTKCYRNLPDIWLTGNNVLASVNCTYDITPAEPLTLNSGLDSKPFPLCMFTELSKNDYLKERTDTVWKQVKADTSYIRVPVQRKVVEQATFEEKAKEAAHHLLRIRKRLFKLLSGAYENVTVNNPGEVAGELRSEEEEYLTLFAGKTFERKITFRYVFTPQNNEQQEKYQPAFFSSDKGLTKEKSVRALAISLEILNLNYLAKAKSSAGADAGNVKNTGLIYRIPETASVKILIGNTVLLEKQVNIAQYGMLGSVPVNLFKGKKHSAEFDINTGNLRGLKR